MFELWQIFLSFFLIGLGAYGGGLVTIPLIQHEIVVSRHWLTMAEMSKVIALAQMTPGPIAINAATFTGYQLGGISGAIAATIAVVLPSAILMTGLLALLHKFKKNTYLNTFRKIVKSAALGLILFAAGSFSYHMLTDVWIWLLAGVSLILLFLTEQRCHPVLIILGAGICGLFLF